MLIECLICGCMCCPRFGLFFNIFFWNECWGEAWRGIGCVVQQFWKYLKLPEVYFSGKWTVSVTSNQGTLFWIIQSRRESEVRRRMEDIACYKRGPVDMVIIILVGSEGVGESIMIFWGKTFLRSALIMVGTSCSHVLVCEAAPLVLYWTHDSSYLHG